MSDLRYGVYLRPDAATALVQSQINAVLVQQFGIVSAAAFPPHATFVGSLRTEATVDELVAVLDGEMRRTAPFTVHNKGIERSGRGWVYNVHEDGRGAPNRALVDVATRIMGALEAVGPEYAGYLVEPCTPERFWGHLSLASHDLAVEPRLIDEVGEFLRALPLVPPSSFVADTVTLFEFTSDDWSGHWWRSLRWRHVHSWRLAGEVSTSVSSFRW